jgi:hypothetical protein
LRYRPRKILIIVEHFGRHCSCHPQGDCVDAGRFWMSCVGQAVDNELDLMMLIGGPKQRTDIQWENSLRLRKRGGEEFLKDAC